MALLVLLLVACATQQATPAASSPITTPAASPAIPLPEPSPTLSATLQPTAQQTAGLSQSPPIAEQEGGQRVIFIHTQLEGQSELRSAALDGSDEYQLAACPSGCSIQLVVPSSDGRQIAYLAQPPGESPVIRLVDANGADRVLDMGGTLAAGAFSPDGGQLAFLRSRQADTPIGSENSVWVVPTAGGEPRQVSPWYTLVSPPMWTDDEHLLYGANESFAEASGQIYRITLTADTEPEPLAGGYPVAISPNRTKLLVALESGDDIAPDTRFAHRVIDIGNPSQPLAVLSLRPGQYVWSPDSTRLAAYTVYGDVQIVDAESGQETLLRPGPEGKEPYRSELAWSPDGQSVIYSAPSAGTKLAFELRRLAVDSSGETVLLQLPVGVGSAFVLTP